MIPAPDLLPRRPAWSIALVSIVAAAVLFLAVLQVRWIGRLTEAERDRLQARLATSVDLFRDSFTRELTQLCIAFRRDPFQPAAETETLYASLYEDWRDSAQHPDLVEALFIGNVGADGRLAISRYDEAAKSLHPVDAREPFASLVGACASGPISSGAPEERLRRPGAWSLTFFDRRPFLVRPMVRFRMPEGPESRGPMRPPGLGAPPGPPFRGPFPPGGGPVPPAITLRGPVRPTGHLFLELSVEYVYGRFLPELSRRIFGDPSQDNYQVAVFLGNGLTDAVFSSGRPSAAAGSGQYDAAVKLLWDPEGRQPGAAEPPAAAAPGQSPFRPMGLVTACDADVQWFLAVRHQAGSVDLAARSLWRRNLAVSAAVLILLTLSILFIIVSAQRTQRLARLQLEFAAGISHEVRTPLAVIGSAGDNLAEGVVAAPDQVREYGSHIRREARRLAEMMEQTLRFAAMQAGSLRYDLIPLDAAEVTRAALGGLAPIVAEAGAEIDLRCEDPAPRVLADAGALSRCVQNLVTNALRYGGEDRKVAVRIERKPDAKLPVRISVSDLGPGILPEDLPHIFDPFYQGRSTAGAKARGVGLGLTLTKDMVQAMGGKITVDTKAGRGTTFSLQLRDAGRDLANDDVSKNTAH